MKVMLTAALVLTAAVPAAATKPYDAVAVLRPLEALWSGTAACDTGEGKLALQLRTDQGSASVNYVLILQSGQKRGESQLPEAGRKNLFRAKQGQMSFLLEFQADGRRLNILSDPQAEGPAALVRVQGDGRIDSKNKKIDLRWTITPAPSVPPELLAAAGFPARESCRLTLARQPLPKAPAAK